jgi:ribose 5-phosphate isomerase B
VVGLRARGRARCGRGARGSGASIAANKVPGVRAALCTDATTAAGARRWNDANVLALSLRLLSEPVLEEILEAWFTAAPSTDPADLAALELLEPAP